MKLKQISMMLCAASVLVACNKNNNSPAPNAETGNTYSGLIFGSHNNGLRAATQKDEAGITGENEINTITLLDVIEKSWTKAASPSQDADKFWQVTGQASTLYTVKPWKTTAGARKMGMIANQGTISTSLLQAKDNQVYSTADKVADLATLSTSTKFVMTSALADKTVLPNITEATAETATITTETASQNIFLFELERVVAQGLVYSDGLADETMTKDGIGSIKKSTLKYTAVNGGAKTYLYATNAGERKMTKEIYKNFTSVIDEEYKSSYKNAKDARTVEENLIRLGNLIESAADQAKPDYDFTTIANKASKLGGYAAKAVEPKPESRQAGIYFLENSTNKEGLTKANKDYGFYRLAYAKIYAKFTPSKVYVNKGATPENGILTKADLKLEAVAADQADLKNDGTFFRGTTDHLLYADYKVALANGNATVDVFYKGMCGYRALWNRQVSSSNADEVINADTRRNNIYELTITGFETLGMPFDSSDPFDPYLPKVTGTGDDGLPPNDKVNPNPDDPDIEKEKTYMRVIAKVADWNLVTRDGIILE